MNKIFKAIIWRLNFFYPIFRDKIKQIKYLIFKPNFICNVCNWKDKKFDNDVWHNGTICPKCKSDVRHRLFWKIIHETNEFNFVNIFNSKKVIHFAPEKMISNEIAKLSKEYHTADFFQGHYTYSDINFNLDISNMSSIKDSSYDTLLAFDVLEHVKLHINALNEIYRILKPNGICVLSIPQKDNLEETIEDLNELSQIEREKKFGQKDHWRIYGNDFKKTLQNVGFNVSVYDSKLITDKNKIKTNVLIPPILSKNSLATNHRKIYFSKKPDQ